MPNAPASSSKVPSAHTKRHRWALERYGHLLLETVRKDVSAEAREIETLPEVDIPSRVIQIIMEKADPSRNKGMTAWLVQQYAAGKLRLEDTGTAYETLEMFDRYSALLPIERRDIGRYRDLADAWGAVLPFATEAKENLSGRAQRAMERDKAYAESRILRQDEDGFTIAVPLTEFAARWWGKGTRWCTGARENNQFWTYHKDAPLIVMVIPELGERGKFQMYVTGEGIQFADAADKLVPDEVIDENWSRFAPLIRAAFEQNGQALRFFPKSLRTEILCWKAVTQNGGALAFVPQHFLTAELCRIAVAQYGMVLRWVPYELCTPELYRIAVAQNGRALRYVPEHFITKEICDLAAAQNVEGFLSIPKVFLTEKIFRIAVEKDWQALMHVPENHRTHELCRIAVEQNGWALSWVPASLCTADLCKVAVTTRGRALEFVPEEFRTEEVCRIAVTSFGRALAYVPPTLITKALCDIAVAQDGRSFPFVPEAYRTTELYRIAVAQNGEALRWAPYELRTDELCRIAVAQNGEALGFVPTHLRAEVEPFVKQKQELPQSPTWDPSLLDGLEEALTLSETPVNRLEEASTLSETPEAERPEEKQTSWIQRKLMGIAERFKSMRKPGNSSLP